MSITTVLVNSGPLLPVDVYGPWDTQIRGWLRRHGLEGREGWLGVRGLVLPVLYEILIRESWKMPEEKHR